MSEIIGVGTFNMIIWLVLDWDNEFEINHTKEIVFSCIFNGPILNSNEKYSSG